MQPLGLLFVAAGIFSICGAVFNWNWFMESRRARGLVRVAGRNGARIFYAVIGLVISTFGLLHTFGVV